MQVQLTKPDFERFVESQVQSGRFPTVEAVVENALSLMMCHGDRLGDPTPEEWAAIDQAMEQAERGEVQDWKKVSAELRARYLGE